MLGVLSAWDKAQDNVAWMQRSVIRDGFGSMNEKSASTFGSKNNKANGVMQVLIPGYANAAPRLLFVPYSKL